MFWLPGHCFWNVFLMGLAFVSNCNCSTLHSYLFLQETKKKAFLPVLHLYRDVIVRPCMFVSLPGHLKKSLSVSHVYRELVVRRCILFLDCQHIFQILIMRSFLSSLRLYRDVFVELANLILIVWAFLKTKKICLPIGLDSYPDVVGRPCILNFDYRGISKEKVPLSVLHLYQDVIVRPCILVLLAGAFHHQIMIFP